MEKKLISYSEEGQVSKLVELLKNVPDTELTDMIDNRTLRGNGEVLPLLQGIIQGLPSTDSHNTKRCIFVYKHCISILEKNEISNRSATNIVGLLMMEADSLPRKALMELSNVYIDMVKNGVLQCGKSLELLPKIVSALGAEYKSHVLNSLCSCRWSPQSVIHLADMFKDVDMTTDELKFVIDKIIRMFKDLDIKDLPSLVYQLLLLSAKGHKRTVIEGIIHFFIEQDQMQREKRPQESELSEDLLESGASYEETLRQMEGTVILHINFAVKFDQGLGREFVKFLKSIQQRSSAEVLAPFNLALALCMVCIHRFEDQILDFLKTTFVKSFKDHEKHSQSGWVREIVPEDCDILALVLETVRNSEHGWDHLVQGLVQIGFVLMDSFGPRTIFGKVESYSGLSKTPTQRACHLGSEMLLHTFKAHEMVRVEILDQIFNRVITKTTSPVSHYLELLAKTVQSFPQIVLECSTKVRETFDYLSYLSPASADSFLAAIQPLLRFSTSLKDALIIVLRKAMFSRQLDSRKIGVNGFLMLLKHFRVLGGIQPSQASQSFSSSQLQVDIHARYNPKCNEALCLEIMGNLRRALTQQADVRIIFYQGIYDVLCRNTKLQGSVLDILLTQLKKYYEPCEDVNPPIKLELCIGSQGDQIYLQEPLAHLIGYIQRCLIKVSDIRRQQRDSDSEDEEAEVLHSKSEQEDIMESLVRRMIKSELEDFELDKSADFSLGNSVGVKNSLFAILVMGIYEALIEYTFISGQFSESSIEEILQLHSNYHKLSSILKDKGGAGKRGKGAGGKTPQSMMSLECALSILDAVVNDMAASHREAVEKLQESTDFQKYVANVAIQKIKDIQDKPNLEANSSKTLHSLCQLGSIFLKYYTENQLNEQEERKTIRGPCLEGLVIIINILIQQYKDQLTSCLCDIVGSQEQDNQQEVIYHCTKKFQRMVMNLLSSEDHHNWKETVHLLNIINTLCQQLSPQGSQYESIQNWVNKLCTEQSIDDIATCKLLFSMLLGMTQQVSSSRCPEMLRDLAQDIHSQLGDIDQEVEVEDRTHFSLVTHRTAAPTVMLLVLSQIERELEDTEWAVHRIKAEIAPDQDSSLTQQEGQEKSICTRLGIIVTAFHEIVQSAIPVGPCVDATIKQVTRLYGTLALLVKYFLSLYTQKAGHLTSRFEKLMKLIGIRLTQYCYPMITYIQTTESEHIQQKGEKNKKDKKAAATAQTGKAKVLKQSKTIPNLIFAIETFEKFVIQLSKKSKVNLMEHMKISTSRDFRINTAALTAALDNGSEEEEEESDDSDENEEMETNEDQENSENEAPEDINTRLEEPAVVPHKKIKLTKNTA